MTGVQFSGSEFFDFLVINECTKLKKIFNKNVIIIIFAVIYDSIAILIKIVIINMTNIFCSLIILKDYNIKNHKAFYINNLAIFII